TSVVACQTSIPPMHGKSAWQKAWLRWHVTGRSLRRHRRRESLAMAEMNDDDLLDALGVEVAPLKSASRTPREERIIAGFEDILRFHQTHGHVPLHGEGRDIFERVYAVRLDQLRKLPEAQTLLAGLDGPGLLSGAAAALADVDNL